MFLEEKKKRHVTFLTLRYHTSATSSPSSRPRCAVIKWFSCQGRGEKLRAAFSYYLHRPSRAASKSSPGGGEGASAGGGRFFSRGLRPFVPPAVASRLRSAAGPRRPPVARARLQANGAGAASPSQLPGPAAASGPQHLTASAMLPARPHPRRSVTQRPGGDSAAGSRPRRPLFSSAGLGREGPSGVLASP